MSSSPANSTLRQTLPVQLLLVATVLAVYYPALLAGLHTLDDPGIVQLYSSSPPLSQVLLPGHGYYYRPLLELSFWLDNLCWGMEPGVMHLENVLLHCLNTLLVFGIARKVGRDGEGDVRVASAAALLFALHPVNVEAVAWIAGRPDLLLALFVLSACRFWLDWLSGTRPRDLAASLFFLLAALFTKETAIAAGAVFLVFALVWPGSATVRQRGLALCLIAAPPLVLVLFALLFRSGTSALSRFASLSGLDAATAAGDALSAVGFYARKLVLPVPLNFAIASVDPHYALLGAALIAGLLLLFRSFRLSAACFASAFLMVLPAVLVAVRQVAWTRFAERYLYLPCAFAALGVACLVAGRKPAQRKLLFAAAVPLLLALAAVDLQRTLLWGDKFAFFQDAVEKSPDFGSVHYELGAQLLKRGELPQAAEAFAMADRLNQRDSMRQLIKANLLAVAFAEEDYLKVRTLFFKTYSDKGAADADSLELLHRADSRRLPTVSGSDRVDLTRDILETLDLLDKKRYDPFWFYRSGQLMLSIGEKEKAAEFFSRAHRLAPADAHYRKPAELYLRNLGSVR